MVVLNKFGRKLMVILTMNTRTCVIELLAKKEMV